MVADLWAILSLAMDDTGYGGLGGGIREGKGLRLTAYVNGEGQPDHRCWVAIISLQFKMGSFWVPFLIYASHNQTLHLLLDYVSYADNL